MHGCMMVCCGGSTGNSVLHFRVAFRPRGCGKVLKIVFLMLKKQAVYP